MESTTYHLTNTDFRCKYVKECNKTNQCLIHLTFTLHPSYNNADILTQYRAMINEIKNSNIFYYKKPYFTLHPGFYNLMLVPELTKTINIHFHGILTCDPKDAEYFRNSLRKLCWNNKELK